MKNLLLEIINCPNIKDGMNPLNPCLEIVNCQYIDPKQLPEPWNGEINLAPILFLSSNPSINISEEFLTKDWETEKIFDFFNYRFSDESKWVKNELYPLLNNGEYNKTWVRFWGAIRKTASILLNKQAIAGKDYAMTEVVRCKSIAEKGVYQAKLECASRYLSRTLEMSPAKIIICLGDKVSEVMNQIYNLRNFDRVSELEIGNSIRTILFLPHPNARKERTLDRLLTFEEIEKIRERLR